MRLRKQLTETTVAIAAEQKKLERLEMDTKNAGDILAEVQSRQPLVESLVGFLIGTREQNGFGEKYRITALTRSDVTERHA